MSEPSEAFQVDLDELDDLTARAANFIGFLNDSRTGLEQRMATLHQTWSGDAAPAQADAFRQWSAGATDVQEGVDAVRQAAVDAHTRYTTAITYDLINDPGNPAFLSGDAEREFWREGEYLARKLDDELGSEWSVEYNRNPGCRRMNAASSQCRSCECDRTSTSTARMIVPSPECPVEPAQLTPVLVLRAGMEFEVQVEGVIGIGAGGREIHRYSVGEIPVEVRPRLTGVLREVSATGNGTLQLEFESGSSIWMFADSNYEAWSVVGAEGFRMVCMPGGELAVWSAA